MTKEYRKGYTDGFNSAYALRELTWIDIKRIVNIADRMLNKDLLNGANPLTEKMYYEQVLEKYKEEKK